MTGCDNNLLAELATLSSAQYKRLELYPDTIPYNLNESEYLAAWERINDEKKGKYLFTTNYGLERVGYIRRTWEGIRSLFGFENRCDAARVKMTLQKFAYYGYVQGYKQEALTKISTWAKKQYQLSNLFIENVSKTRSDETSVWLQGHLISYYNDHSLFLQPSSWLQYFSQLLSVDEVTLHDPNLPSFRFGMTFSSKESLKIHLIKLDPQNNSIIDSLVNHIINKPASLPLDRLQILIPPNTTLSRALADRLLNDYMNSQTWTGYIFSFVPGLHTAPMPDAVVRATCFDPNLKLRRKDFYIEYYLKNKMFNEAMELLVTLNDIPLALGFIKKYKIDIEILKKYIVSDSMLGAALARSYMENVNSSKYDANDRSADHAKQFLPLKKLHIEYPRYYFLRYVSKKMYEQAYKLYQATRDKSVFNKNNLQELAEYYNRKGKEKLNKSNEKKLEEKWEEAEKLLEESNEAIQIAATSVPESNEYKEDAIMRGFQSGKLIFNSPLYGDQRANRLDTAISRLNTAHEESKKEEVKETLLKALQERAKLALNSCFVNVDLNNGSCASKEHKEKALPYLEKAIECYKRIIDLNADGGYTHLTAEAHFMIADIQEYFSLEKIENGSQGFTRAMEMVPTNPFYTLRAYYRCENGLEEMRDQGVSLLHAQQLRASDYTDWYEGRWLIPEKRISGINNIHNYHEKEQVQKKGWLSYLRGY